MGRQVSYARCPKSPTEMPKEPLSWKWKLCACGFAATLVLSFIFLGLYINLRAGCESRPWNHTSATEGRMTEPQQEAKEESDPLRTQLAAVNQSLTNTTKYWASCREELKLWKKNTSLLEGDIRKQKNDLKNLNDENKDLKTQLTKLNIAQETCKNERDNKDEEIQRLRDELNTRQTSSDTVQDQFAALARQEKERQVGAQNQQCEREKQILRDAHDLETKKMYGERQHLVGEKESLQLQLQQSKAACLNLRPQEVSEPGSKCDRAQLLAEVASLKGQLGTLKKEMEKEKLESDRQLATINQTLSKTKLALEKATKGSDGLRAQLAAANQSLAQTKQHWTSCQAQLDSMKRQTTSLQQENQRLRAKTGNLQQQLSSRERELENAKWMNNQRWVENRMQQNYHQQEVAMDIIGSPWFIIAVIFLLLLLICKFCPCQ